MTKLFGSIFAIALLSVSAAYFFFRPEVQKTSDRRRVINRTRAVYRNTTGYVQRLFVVKNPQEPEIVRAAAA